MRSWTVIVLEVSNSGSAPPPPSRCPLVPDAHPDPQEAEALFEATAGRAGGRVHAERVHHQAAAEGAVRPAQPQRPTGQDLVSEPANEEEETFAEGAGFVLLLRSRAHLSC